MLPLSSIRVASARCLNMRFPGTRTLISATKRVRLLPLRMLNEMAPKELSYRSIRRHVSIKMFSHRLSRVCRRLQISENLGHFAGWHQGASRFFQSFLCSFLIYILLNELPFTPPQTFVRAKLKVLQNRQIGAPSRVVP